MNYLHRLELWGESHHSKWLDIIRVALGLFLCYKGISFLFDMSVLIGYLNNSNMGAGSFALVLLGQVIVVLHLLGGFFIAIGLHTRLACISQMPILIGAIILLRFTENGSVAPQELTTSIVVLLLLILFLVLGNGPWSYDKMYKENKE
ncbi:MAG: DoxX family protein [Bacteroidetes bacterium]|nr:DoxX family protein [Bacteroidota bacterium]